MVKSDSIRASIIDEVTESAEYARERSLAQRVVACEEDLSLLQLLLLVVVSEEIAVNQIISLLPRDALCA